LEVVLDFIVIVITSFCIYFGTFWWIVLLSAMFYFICVYRRNKKISALGLRVMMIGLLTCEVLSVLMQLEVILIQNEYTYLLNSFGLCVVILVFLLIYLMQDLTKERMRSGMNVVLSVIGLGTVLALFVFGLWTRYTKADVYLSGELQDEQLVYIVSQNENKGIMALTYSNGLLSCEKLDFSDKQIFRVGQSEENDTYCISTLRGSKVITKIDEETYMMYLTVGASNDGNDEFVINYISDFQAAIVYPENNLKITLNNYDSSASLLNDIGQSIEFRKADMFYGQYIFEDARLREIVIAIVLLGVIIAVCFVTCIVGAKSKK